MKFVMYIYISKSKDMPTFGIFNFAV